MDELNQYQKSLIDALESENERYETLATDLDLDTMLAKANYYCQKLAAVRRDMATLRSTSDQLRRRALRLQSQTSRHVESRETEKYMQTERDRRLQPVMPSPPPEKRQQ